MGAIVVFAHIPPPHHGQSAMVKEFVDALAEPSFEESGGRYFHIDCRLSESADEIGNAGLGKVIHTISFCLQALKYRFFHGADTCYYVPSPAKKNSLIRDWIVFGFCFPFFPKVILHWHAAGLGSWVSETDGAFASKITKFLFRRKAVSIALNSVNAKEVAIFEPGETVVIPNGITDPCADSGNVIEMRESRLNAGGREKIELLYIGLGTREKGLFDAISVTRKLNELSCVNGGGACYRLKIAGSFLSSEDEKEFWKLGALDASDGKMPVGSNDFDVWYLGFQGGSEKDALFRESDIMLFPSLYRAENQPLVLAEAMAYGLPVVTRAWRGIPAMLPENYVGIAEERNIESLVEIIGDRRLREQGALLRRHFEENFTIAQHRKAMLRIVETTCAK